MDEITPIYELCNPYYCAVFMTIATSSPDPIHAEYLQHLNTEQMQAVQTVEGPLLVLAGAGTGKTRVLIARIAHLMLTGRAYPSQILAVTFTNKAAREMTRRLTESTDHQANSVWLGTFHSIAAKILRRHAELVGLKSDFTIIDMDDQVRLLKSIMISHHVDDKKFAPKTMLGLIQKWKDQGLLPDKVPASEAQQSVYHSKAFQLYKEYQQRLTALGVADFGDLLLHNLTLFLQHSDILAEYHRRFKYILVDEYQDTNVAQYLWLRLLAQGHKNICCVGDDDQSIYGWRGAEVGNILKFEQDFPGATIIRLEQNYRSTTHILGAASGLIATNSTRLGKTLWTDSDGGEKVRILASLMDGREEVKAITAEIESLQRGGHPLSEVAILVRAGFQTRLFEESFIASGVPYRVVGGLRFYERMEIRDVLAYMRISLENSDDLAFERIVNTPRRYIGEATLAVLREYAQPRNISMVQAVREMLNGGELKRAKGALETLVASFDRWRDGAKIKTPAELVEQILIESGYLEMWKNDKSLEAEGRVENIKELLRGLQEAASITEFLERVSLVMDIDKNETAAMVSIMTLHAAKGLEFDVVFLPGWEEGIFPHQKSLDENGTAGLEEERRLAYVGITRARKKLTISFAANRYMYGQWQSSISSRFIDELPKEHITITHQSSGYYPATSSFDVPKIKQSLQGTIAQAAKAMTARTDTAADSFTAGERVFHEKFGYGYITAVSGNHLDVNFEKSGGKKVMSGFVTKFKK
jgi:DNA helicase-2/ATP-dependent DNA helicase PcrA